MALKRFLLIALCLAIPAVHFGLSNNMDSKVNVLNQMISNRVFLDDEGIIEMTSNTVNIPDVLKNDLYQSNQKNLFWMLLPNIFVPSLGNWLAGDKNGAIVIDALVGGGIVLVGIGYLPLLLYNRGALTFSDSFLVMGVGVLAIGVGYIINLVMPFTYTDHFNRKLKEGLSITFFEGPGIGRSFSINPKMDAPDMQHVQLDIISLRF